ncbi:MULTISPECIES: hypothetical protein [unclassified Paraburkholderia]|uniref:hypothetical protein n=1 Tax=unclassified Paraburkholderia TaxID=2615204 RepID=UPI002AAF4D81|nr:MULTISPECIES: hypothetical protein [unclassified Paraburkholderia]
MTIRVNLNYYNNDHRILLTTHQPYAAAGTAARVAFYRRNPVIRRADFLSYFLIHRQALSGYRTYQDLLTKAHAASTWIEDVIVPTSPTIQLAQQGYSDNGLSERIGESIGLSVISRLHGMTDADWTKLDTISGVNGQPTFDFQIGSDGARIIQVEAKGSMVDDCTKKPSKVSNHASNIAHKKSGIAQLATYRYPSSIRYGTIAAIDATHDAQCWLLDPPAQDFSIAPQELRIIKRLAFAAKSIALVAPTATLPAAIAKRINEIWKGSANAFEGKVLQTGTGTLFSHQTYVEQYLSSRKTYLRDIDVVGRLLPSDHDSPMFIGMMGNLARLAIQQSFSEIVNIEYSQTDLGVHQITAGDPTQEVGRGRSKRIPMRLAVSSGGLVFGHAAR